ncbi:hypothetical protein [Streptosporangium sp. NPDC001681]|uniref:hypothetical protein n=1 Tax=Streptosporangium sp. NPDC001681 TaxID=3154395 RepID=UPI00331C39C7
MTTTHAPLRNGPLLAAAIASIEGAVVLREQIATGAVTPDPDVPITLWDQRSWRNDFYGFDRCGTTQCLAGWVAELGGAKWLVTFTPDGPMLGGRRIDVSYTELRRLAEYVMAEPDDPEQWVIEVLGDRVIPVQIKAMRYLALSPMIVRNPDGTINRDVHHDVFLGHQTLNDIRDWYARLYPAS